VVSVGIITAMRWTYVCDIGCITTVGKYYAEDAILREALNAQVWWAGATWLFVNCHGICSREHGGCS
jgi:hypothetical protein